MYQTRSARRSHQISTKVSGPQWSSVELSGVRWNSAELGGDLAELDSQFRARIPDKPIFRKNHEDTLIFDENNPTLGENPEIFIKNLHLGKKS